MVRSFVFSTVLAMLPFLAGCGATIEQLKSRASYDMNCPEEELVVINIDHRTKGIRGCGKKSTYLENCEHMARIRSSCAWKLDTVKEKDVRKEPKVRKEEEYEDEGEYQY